MLYHYKKKKLMLKDHENNNYQPNLGSNNYDLRTYKLDSLVPSKTTIQSL